MRKIVHISDLHFGKENPATVEKLVEAVNEIGPHLTVVSGDLTQRRGKVNLPRHEYFLIVCPVRVLLFPAIMMCRFIGWRSVLLIRLRITKNS